MNRAEYVAQTNVALARTVRAMIVFGWPAAMLQLGIVAAMFILAGSDPASMPVFFAVALPVSIILCAAVFVAIGKSFARSSPVCSSCGQSLKLLKRRRAVHSGCCPNCHAKLFH